MIIACVPVDRSQLPDIPEVSAIVVTDLYTLMNCHQCEQPIWVGPRQLEHWQTASTPQRLLCYLCAAHSIRAMGADAEIHDLGGGYPREGRPRTL